MRQPREKARLPGIEPRYKEKFDADLQNFTLDVLP